MRRLLTLAAFLLILSLVPVCAQRGGRGGGGGHGGSGGGHGGFGGHAAVAGHSVGGGFAGAHLGSSFSSRLGSYAGSHSGLESRGFHGDRFHGDRFHGDRFRGGHFGYGFRNRCYGCWGYGYPYYGYYDPYWWWDSGSSFDEEQARDRQLANEMNEENLEEQRMLREQDQDAYARPMGPPRDTQAREEEHAQKDAATVLVFRDQHQREIQNYAIADGVLWNFTGSRTEKIPLAIIDIPATIKANDDHGVDFRLPGASEGQ